MTRRRTPVRPFSPKWWERILLGAGLILVLTIGLIRSSFLPAQVSAGLDSTMQIVVGVLGSILVVWVTYEYCFKIKN